MKNKIILIYLFLLALIIRLYFLPTAKIIESDGVVYTRLAESLMNGKGFIDLDGKRSIITRPLYPVLIGLVNKIDKNWESSGRIVSIFFGSLIPILIYLLSKEIFEKKESILAAIFVSISPIMASASIQVMTETVYIFVISLGILFLYYALRKGTKLKFFLSGIIWGLPYLTRPEGIGYLAVCFAIILFINWPNTSLRHRMIFASWFILGAFICIFPLIMYLRISTGTWTISQEISHLGTIELTTYLRNLYYSVYIQQIPRIFPPLLIILFSIGFLKSIFSDKKVEDNVYLGSFVFYSLLIYPWNTKTTISCRHYVIILPLLYVWVANGVIVLSRWLSGRNKGKKNLKIFSTPFLIFLVLINFMPRLIEPLKKTDPFLEYPLEYKMVSRWIKENLGQDNIIMSRIRQIAFYSHAKLIIISKDIKDYKQLIKYARSKKVDYIVIDKRWTTRIYPWLYFLLDETNIPQDLELVYKWDKRPEYKVIVYKLKKE